MQIIKNFVDAIDSELEDAQKYAEHFIEAKAKNDITAANKYKEMALDELKHSNFQHEMAVKTIAEVEHVYTAPVAMQEKWEKAHKGYVEKVALIRHMLDM